MIHEVSGDILLSKAQVIAHGLAINDPMKTGLAKELHERYPSMHKDFHHWCHHSKPETGSAWMWGGPGGVRIVNLITQEGGGPHNSHPHKATLGNVRNALKDLHKLAKKEQFTSIALPRLATGVGGLDWADVRQLIQEHMKDLDIPIFVYSTYHAGQAANEPGLNKA